MISKTKGKISILQAAFQVIPITYRAAPIMFIFSVIGAMLHGVSYAVITVFMQRFLDNVAQYVDKTLTIHTLMISLSFLGLSYVANQLLHGLFNFMYVVQGKKVQGQLSVNIHEKMGKLSPICFEDTHQLDDIEKANEGMNNSVWFSMTFLLTFTFYIPYLLFMSVYLYDQKPVFVITIFLAFLPMIVTQIFRSKVYIKLQDEKAPMQRKFNYYEECLTGNDYFKETRLLGAYQFFHKLYVETLVQLNKLRMKANIKSSLFELAMKGLTILSYGLILYMLFDAIMKGEISIGVFAAVFASLARLFSLLHELVCDHFTYLSEDLGSIVNYLRFLGLPEDGGKMIDITTINQIELKNISFAYPHTNQNAISSLSLAIKGKETIAIVGENGAGKSTLIRLIVGLYKPTSGEVLINGVNTKDVSMPALFLGTSAVFQHYQRYKLSLQENIRLSDTKRKSSIDELDEVTAKAGFSSRDKQFIDGYDTILSREFDGTDLSGGQWQRIALARAFYRRHSMIILDEPTAAIDPLKEERIYRQFSEIARDKLAFIVTHRIGSAKIADLILVMSDGKLVESGTHEHLMQLKGQYYKLFLSQQQWYV